MSNVEAVEAAQATQKAAEQTAAKEIAEYKASTDKRIADAINAKNTVIKQAKDKVKAAEKSRQIAWLSSPPASNVQSLRGTVSWNSNVSPKITQH